MHAYDEKYLDDAMNNLGEMLEYAMVACGMDGDKFWDLFINTGYARRFEKGEPSIVSGRSGTELAYDIFYKVDEGRKMPTAIIDYTYSPEFWSGWILAYYQWFTGRSFKDIRNYISIEDVLKLYPTLHEAPEDKFVDVVNNIIRRNSMPTKLSTLRRLAGYSQRILAEKSGVNLRTLQQYEIRAKDINKASGASLLAISKVLGCRIEDLLEYDIIDTEEIENN